MLTEISPKLPMRDKAITREFYFRLGFKPLGQEDYEGYLMLHRDQVEIHFFEFKELSPTENYGMVYIRTNAIETLYQSFIDNNVAIHPNGPLAVKPWGQKEFSILDPDNNLLTFGQGA
ncbi:VOC family protein [Chitinophaga sp. sic0106]|uniref:bleomycin resistance protein n=1 Tax=Chitinophaga sp. sic0106 TaxID=2854785 RepID=UPI001C44EB35|nr:VOC family protein [Chitinophaga sp. sic0106]MBV7530909.1 VOC family protein [Chitinophaga sp. sic0106]